MTLKNERNYNYRYYTLFVVPRFVLNSIFLSTLHSRYPTHTLTTVLLVYSACVQSGHRGVGAKRRKSRKVDSDDDLPSHHVRRNPFPLAVDGLISTHTYTYNIIHLYIVFWFGSGLFFFVWAKLEKLSYTGAPSYQGLNYRLHTTINHNSYTIVNKYNYIMMPGRIISVDACVQIIYL